MKVQLRTVEGVPVAAFPGASIMHVEVVPEEGLEISCPECQATEFVPLPDESQVADLNFAHITGSSIGRSIAATLGEN